MQFIKYQGCGNDFIVIENLPEKDQSYWAKVLCKEHLGIGADGLIIVNKNPLEMRIYNKDGSEASMCGNGLRAFARYCYQRGIVNNKTFSVKTKAGIMQVFIESLNPFLVKINLGKPSFDKKLLGIGKDVFGYTYKEYTLYSVFIGTIHTIIFVKEIKDIEPSLGKEICNLHFYKNKTNVDFVEVINKSQIKVQTYEKGVGYTLACGTGCAAAVIVSKLLGYTDSKVDVFLEVGKIRIEYNDTVFLEGPIEKVFEGNISID